MLLNERVVTRRTQIIRIVVVAVLVLGGLSTWFAYPRLSARYQAARQENLRQQVQTFLAEDDLPNARLAIEIAARSSPGDLETLRLLATYLDRVGSPEVLGVRRAILRLDPHSTADRARLVFAALDHRDFNIARDAVAEFTPSQADEPVALEAALALALAADQRPVADVIFNRLRALDPDNENLAVLHASLRLHHPTRAAEARAELIVLAEQPRHALFIHRRLLQDAALRRDLSAIRRHAAAAAAHEKAVLADRLALAQLDLQADLVPLEEVLARLKPAVATDPASTSELVRWLLLLGKPEAADRWLDQLPPDPVLADTVRRLRAESAVARQDWTALEPLLAAGAWGARSIDAVRLAFTSRVAAERGNTSLQRALWQEALAAAGRHLADLAQLHRLAALWQWDDHAETVLWAIVRAHPTQAWAHQTLFGTLRARQDTASLRNLMDTLRQLDPTTPRYRHDWALFSLLLNRSSDWNPPKTTLAELHRASPDNPHYILGYAYALALSHRANDAVELLSTLPSALRADPARAPYLAYIYGHARDTEAFQAALANRAPSPRAYLPEENRLFVLGQVALERPLPSLPAASDNVDADPDASPEADAAAAASESNPGAS